MFVKSHAFVKVISYGCCRNFVSKPLRCHSHRFQPLEYTQRCQFSVHKEQPVNLAKDYTTGLTEQEYLPQKHIAFVDQKTDVPTTILDNSTEINLSTDDSQDLSGSVVESETPVTSQTLLTTKETSKSNTKKQKKKNQLHIPSWFNKEKYETTNSVSSFVYTFKEIACVTMNKNFEVTNISTRKFSKNFRASTYWEIVNSLVEKVPSDSLCLVEHISLPAKFHQVNLHQRTLQMLLFGMLQTKEDRNKIVTFSRKAVGSMFDLNIKKALNRMDSQTLVKDIVTTQHWKDISLNIPMSTFWVKNDKLYFNEMKDDVLVSRICMQEVSDGLLQAIAFWSIANASFDKTKSGIR